MCFELSSSLSLARARQTVVDHEERTAAARERKRTGVEAPLLLFFSLAIKNPCAARRETTKTHVPLELRRYRPAHENFSLIVAQRSLHLSAVNNSLKIPTRERERERELTRERTGERAQKKNGDSSLSALRCCMHCLLEREMRASAVKAVPRGNRGNLMGL